MVATGISIFQLDAHLHNNRGLHIATGLKAGTMEGEEKKRVGEIAAREYSDA